MKEKENISFFKSRKKKDTFGDSFLKKCSFAFFLRKSRAARITLQLLCTSNTPLVNKEYMSLPDLI